MKETYNHSEIEPEITRLWEEKANFSPVATPGTKPFSLFLVPPNASGPMHIGNALMLAIQDILARYHRALGKTTVWVPSTDHGGYETQILFEKELENRGENKSDYKSSELFRMIAEFARRNNNTIAEQITSLGASVDWTRFRFTLDQDGITAATGTFKQMVSDNLIYRRPYMVHYCHSCGTVLSDIELKEHEQETPLYFIRFPFADGGGELILETTRPEFLFATTHVLAHPNDPRISAHIGRWLINPSTGATIEIVVSKRKFDPSEPDPLQPFNPSFDKYDYGYTLRNTIPSRNLLDWNGKMIEQYPGLTPTEARAREVEKLKDAGYIAEIDETHREPVYLCKRGHVTENIIRETWFLKVNDEKISLCRNALEAIKREGLVVLPHWQEKGLVEWISKMADWPIARQNVWGIRIPVWYEIDDPSKFRIWFVDRENERRIGQLSDLLDMGYTIDDIAEGLERIYAESGAAWTLEREAGKTYLPETDTFDTWFSSGQWATNVYTSSSHPEDAEYFYPSDSIVIGHDLLRLSVSRKIILSQYLSKRLPFHLVYLHRLIRGADGQKMSKSLGNAVNLETFIEKYGADATRMALISYSAENEDFILEDDHLVFFNEFCSRLWNTAKVVELANEYNIDSFNEKTLSPESTQVVWECEMAIREAGKNIEKYRFAHAQQSLSDFLPTLEEFAASIQESGDIVARLATLTYVFERYITALHPFMPFITESIHSSLYGPDNLLASAPWPSRQLPNKQ